MYFKSLLHNKNKSCSLVRLPLPFDYKTLLYFLCYWLHGTTAEDILATRDSFSTVFM